MQSGTNLLKDNSATGSFLTGYASLDGKWNPVSFTNHCIVDVTTGLLKGTITFVFADGSTLFGNEMEDVHELVATNGTSGAFTETYTFTGGTGEFAGVSGSVSGAGRATAAGFTESGTGSLNAAAVSTPEPASLALIMGGLLIVVGRRKTIAVIR